MNIFSFALAVYGIVNIKILGNLRIFILLPTFSFIDSFSLILLTQILDHKNTFQVFSEYFQIIFLNYELAIIIIFYLKIVLNIKNKLFHLVPIFTSSILLFFRHYSGQNIVNDYLPFFVVIEALIVDISFGVLIYRKIKKEKSILRTWEDQINKGFFLFVNTTAPYYLVINYIDNYQEAAATSLNFIGSFGYIILFYHIFKAIKCSLLK